MLINLNQNQFDLRFSILSLNSGWRQTSFLLHTLALLLVSLSVISVWWTLLLTVNRQIQLTHALFFTFFALLCVCVCEENMAALAWCLRCGFLTLHRSKFLPFCLCVFQPDTLTHTPDLTSSLSHKWQCANMLNAPIGLFVCGWLCIDQ